MAPARTRAPRLQIPILQSSVRELVVLFVILSNFVEFLGHERWVSGLYSTGYKSIYRTIWGHRLLF